MLYTEKIILVTVRSTKREGGLADKIKKMLLMYAAWMIPVLRNVQHINECYVQAARTVCTFVCCDVYRSTLCVDRLRHAFFHVIFIRNSVLYIDGKWKRSAYGVLTFPIL